MSARRDFLVSLASQAVVVVAGFVRAFAVPIIFATDVSGYANWQTYLLYAGLVSFLLLGLNDGYLLRFRMAVGDAERTRRGSALRLSWLWSVIESSALYVGLLLIAGPGEPWLWGAVLLNVPLLALGGTCLYFLHMTKRFPEASWVVASERIGFVVALPLLYWGGWFAATTLVLTDLVTRCAVALVVLCRHRREMLDGGFSLRLGLAESGEWVIHGFPVMVGSYMVILSASLVRLLVERTGSDWDFANYALAFSLTNILLVLGKALGTVLFPHLAGADIEQLARHLSGLDRFLAYLFPLFLLGYFPLVIAIEWALPQYSHAPTYLAPLLVVVGFQVVIGSLNNPYYKLLGLERRLLIDNVVALLVLMAVTSLLTDNIVVMTFSQAAVLASLAYLSHRRFTGVLRVSFRSRVPGEVAWALIFGLLLSLFDRATAALVMFAAIGCFYVVQRRRLGDLLRTYVCG